MSVHHRILFQVEYGANVTLPLPCQIYLAILTIPQRVGVLRVALPFQSIPCLAETPPAFR